MLFLDNCLLFIAHSSTMFRCCHLSLSGFLLSFPFHEPLLGLSQRPNSRIFAAQGLEEITGFNQQIKVNCGWCYGLNTV